MKKIITTLILLLFYFSFYGQDSLSNCLCSAYFGNLSPKKDTMNNDFYKKYHKITNEYSDGCDDIKILKDSADYFYIQPFYLSPKHKSKKYWLKKNNQMFVNPLSNYAGYIVLYSNHDFKANKVFVHKYGHPPIDQVSHSMIVLNCFKEWVKVSLTFKGKEYIGWTKFYCPLGCTTCT